MNLISFLTKRIQNTHMVIQIYIFLYQKHYEYQCTPYWPSSTSAANMYATWKQHISHQPRCSFLPPRAFRSCWSANKSMSLHSSPSRCSSSCRFAAQNSKPRAEPRTPRTHSEMLPRGTPKVDAALNKEGCHIHSPVSPFRRLHTGLRSDLLCWHELAKKCSRFSEGVVHSKFSKQLFPLSKSLWLTMLWSSDGGGPRNAAATKRCTSTPCLIEFKQIEVW